MHNSDNNCVLFSSRLAGRRDCGGEIQVCRRWSAAHAVSGGCSFKPSLSPAFLAPSLLWLVSVSLVSSLGVRLQAWVEKQQLELVAKVLQLPACQNQVGGILAVQHFELGVLPGP